jgi:hypothetical protein
MKQNISAFIVMLKIVKKFYKLFTVASIKSSSIKNSGQITSMSIFQSYDDISGINLSIRRMQLV